MDGHGGGGYKGVTTVEIGAETMAGERSHLYRLLARVFGAEPGPEVLAVTRVPAFTGLVAALGVPMDAAYRADGTVEDLAIEYTRLFLGPGPHITPTESAQRGDGSLWGPETVEVRRLLGEAGFDLAWQELPDHITVELDFLAHLTAIEANAWERGDRILARRSREWQEAFLSRHLGAWVDGFCARVRAAEVRSPFYATFIAILQAFMESERTFIAATEQAEREVDSLADRPR